MTDDKKKGTRYSCPSCDQHVTVFVKVSEPPMHHCGGSKQPSKWLPLQEDK